MSEKKQKNDQVEVESDNAEIKEEQNSENEIQNNAADENIQTDNDDNNNEVENNNEEDNVIEQLRDEKLRLLAEMENLRKRSERDRVDSIRYGSINLARDILSLNDNLSRALDAIPEEEKNSETFKNLTDGLKMVQRDFSTILEKHGVKKIDALNKKFDHNFHQAMMEIETNESEEGLVVQEIQSGYTMHERLLRPSMVGVSKKTLKTKENNENEEKG